MKRRAVGLMMMVAAMGLTLGMLACSGQSKPPVPPPPPVGEPPMRLAPSGPFSQVGFERSSPNHPCAGPGSSVITVDSPAAHYVWPPSSLGTAEAAHAIAILPGADWSTPTDAPHSFDFGCSTCVPSNATGSEIVYAAIDNVTPDFVNKRITFSAKKGGADVSVTVQLQAATFLPFYWALGACVGQDDGTLHVPQLQTSAKVVFVVGSPHSHGPPPCP